MSIKCKQVVGLVLGSTLLFSAPAFAQGARVRPPKGAHPVSHVAEMKAPPLTIQKRSFLDPGNVVSPGTDTPEYIAANTTDNVPIYQGFAPARYGESALAGRFDLPNNPRFAPNRDLDFSPF